MDEQTDKQEEKQSDPNVFDWEAYRKISMVEAVRLLAEAALEQWIAGNDFDDEEGPERELCDGFMFGFMAREAMCPPHLR